LRQLLNPKATKIVIAEDDSASRELLCLMLRSWGYEVIEARNGADALQQIAESLPNLIVCDIQMPVLDGVGLVQALRRNKDLATLPVIALTGVGTQDREAIASAGFTTYQSKPVVSELLKRNVERLLQKKPEENKGA
jgi:CheY-like chemotaxis protein